MGSLPGSLLYVTAETVLAGERLLSAGPHICYVTNDTPALAGVHLKPLAPLLQPQQPQAPMAFMRMFTCWQYFLFESYVLSLAATASRWLFASGYAAALLA